MGKREKLKMDEQKDSTDKNTGLNDVNKVEVDEDAQNETPDTPTPTAYYKCYPTPSIQYVYHSDDSTTNTYSTPHIFNTNNDAYGKYPPDILKYILLDHNYCKRRLDDDEDSDDDRLVIDESDEIINEDTVEDPSFNSKYLTQDLDERNLPLEESTTPRVKQAM